jgi:hypothetical protein
MTTLHASYDELYAYTMGRPGFILQHVVDAFAAQTANQDSKPIGIVFALVGLYLHVEKHLSGHQIQKVHMQLGGRKREWPSVRLPEDRGSITAIDVLTANPGAERDQAIDSWCRSVWSAYYASRDTVIALLMEYKIG